MFYICISIVFLFYNYVINDVKSRKSISASIFKKSEFNLKRMIHLKITLYNTQQTLNILEIFIKCS